MRGIAEDLYQTLFVQDIGTIGGFIKRCHHVKSLRRITKALPKAEAIELVKVLVEEIILKHEAPREMISDLGQNLCENYVQQLITRAEKSRQLAKLHTLDAQSLDKQRYDKRRLPVNYNVGDLVWVLTPVREVELSEKPLRRYFGPYRIIQRLSDVTDGVQSTEVNSR
ncbi:transposon Ty3-I Gag-Pol polyprotein [Trichonephila inaurata madagascariensis]|uniref:Transposon Ty3-I Gag-Pol polyprotein n=1 Tax=Trichonephila inaurata madagascariensis TaxID=2747483 RepID=A0A8X6XH39_9ARAC|nr:transposon Ty3-I Gag-Pol polyprotein [Trichonephila inaurata madagascariensis]